MEKAQTSEVSRSVSVTATVPPKVNYKYSVQVDTATAATTYDGTAVFRSRFPGIAPQTIALNGGYTGTSAMNVTVVGVKSKTSPGGVLEEEEVFRMPIK